MTLKIVLNMICPEEKATANSYMMNFDYICWLPNS